MIFKFIDNSENPKQCRENAKKRCGEMQPEFFFITLVSGYLAHYQYRSV